MPTKLKVGGMCYVLHGPKLLTCLTLLSPHQAYQVGTVLPDSHLQVRKLRHRESEWPEIPKGVFLASYARQSCSGAVLLPTQGASWGRKIQPKAEEGGGCD